MRQKSRLLQLMALLFAFTLVAAACSSDSGDGAGTDTAESDDSGETETTDPPADDSGETETTDPPADDSGETAAGTIGDPEIDTLRICQAPSFSGITTEIAVTQGLLEARGITGELISCASGPANAAALISRQVDVVANTPDNMLGIRNADFDVVMFGQTIDNHFFDIVVSNDVEVDCDQGDWECAMAALDGMNAGVVARGAAAEQIARQLLDSAGLDPENTTYIATGLAGTTLAALSSGEIDWTITFEPAISQAQVDGIGHSPFSLRAGDGPAELDWPSLVMTTSRAVWEESPNAMLHYRAAVVEAGEWMRDPANRDAVLAEMGTFLGLEGEIAETILDSNIGSLTSTGVLDQGRVENNVAYAVGRGILAAPQEFGEFAVGPDIDVIVPDALTPETDTVRICQAASFSGMAVHVAVTKGLLESKGLNGEEIACESGPANAAALVSGQVEFVANTPDNMLGLRNADFDVVMFGQVIDKHFFDILVRSDIELDCEQGDWECVMPLLDGMNVGVVANGAAAEQIARQLYDSAGLNPDDSTYIATGLAGTTLAALGSGEIDWTITFEPALTQGAVEGIGYAPFSLRGGDGPAELNWPSLVLTTSREFAESNPNTVALFREANREAADWMRNPANRDEVLALMGDFLGLEGEIAERTFDDNIGSFSLNFALNQARLENNVNYAVGRGILDEAIPYEDFVFAG